MTVASALASQGRVIHALMLREIKTRFGKLKLGYLWAFVEPIMFVVILAVIFNATGARAPGGMSLTLFLGTGVLGYIFFRNGMQFTMMALRINKVLLTFPQVTPFELVVARVLLEFVTLLLVSILLLLIFVFISDERVLIEDPIGLLGSLVLMTTIGFGSGMFFSGLVPSFPSTQEIVNSFILRPSFFLAGIFYTADMMPEDIRFWLLFNPILHVTEMIRSAFFFGFDSEYATPEYPMVFALVTVFLGFLMLRAFRARIYEQ